MSNRQQRHSSDSHFVLHKRTSGQQYKRRYWSESLRRVRGWGFLLLSLTVAFCLVTFPRLTTAPVLGASPPSLSVNSSNPQALLQQGRTLYESGQLSAAAAILQQAVRGYRAQGDALSTAMSLSNLALVYEQLGSWAEANQALTQSLEILQTQRDSDNQRLSVLAQTLEIQGRVQLAQGQAEAALATWEQAATIYRQVGNEIDATQTQIRQAQALQILGFHQRAIALLQPLSQSLENQSDSPTKAMGLRSLGEVLQVVGNLDQAYSVTQKSLEVAQRLQLPQAIASAQLSLGNIARAQQKNEETLNFYQQVAKGSGSPTIKLQAQLNQLSFLLETNQASQAQALVSPIQQQINALPPSRTTVYAQINFARSLTRLNQLNTPSSLSWADITQGLITARGQAEALGDQRAQAYAMGHLGEIYERTKQWNEAQTLTEQALFLSQKINANDMTYRWHWQIGRILEAQGKPEKAIAAYSSAVDILQSLRSDLVTVNPEVQFSFKESVEPIHRELVSLLLKDNDGKSSPEKLEKARQVMESLQIAELNNFLREACLDVQAVKLDEVAGVQQVAVIYPIILPDRLEVIINLPGRQLSHKSTKITSEEVEALVERLQGALYNRISLEFRPLSQQVYDLLIRPIEQDLGQSQVDTLVFVLDGALRNIPMGALNDGQQYLLEKYAIALTPGLQLVSPRPLQQRNLSVLAVGITEARQWRSQQFSPLPNVEPELKTIQAELPTRILLDEDFTIERFKAAVKSSAAPIVHLATHGQFSSRQEETFILTGEDNVAIDVGKLNSLLQSSELGRSEPIELLVLSACQTASGDKRAALGLAGVAVRAGARSTVASLWSVNDEATSMLMGRFYEELARQDVTKAEALRQAQLSILQDPRFRRHPYFWAPFILVGNWL
jgi:CHAT domain-containing protein